MASTTKSLLPWERTAISWKPEETIKNDLELLRDEQQLSPDIVFRDPYFLDFLGLKDSYSEKDLKTAILADCNASSLRWEATLLSLHGRNEL